MSTIQDTLVNAGFEPSVAKIYTILVENNELAVNEIVKRSELSRAGAYDALNILLVQGYVEYRKEGRNAYYKALHPNKLYAMVEQKKRNEVLFEQEMGETIKTLIGSFNLSNNKPGVRFFEGEEGLKEIYLDTLKEPETIYALLSPAAVKDSLKDWLNGVYVKQRVDKKIEAKVIAPASNETDLYHQEDKTNFRETVVVSPTNYPVEIEIDIYGKQKVAFISFNEKEMVGFIIDSPAIYKTMKTLFNLSWMQAKTFSKLPTSSSSLPPPTP